MENDNAGFIVIHRKLMDNPIMFKQNYLVIWVYLLLRANYKDSYIIINNKKTLIKRGSFLGSLQKLSKLFNISISTVKHIIDYLCVDGMLNTERTNKHTVFTILNYDKYQDVERQPNTSRTPAERQPNASRTPAETDNKDNKLNKGNKESSLNTSARKGKNSLDAGETFLEFPTGINDESTGEPIPWKLTVNRLNWYKGLYPDRSDLEEEFQDARRWALSNPAKRKTSRGYVAFLTNWLKNSKNKKSNGFQQKKKYSAYDERFAENESAENKAKYEFATLDDRIAQENAEKQRLLDLQA